MADIPINQVTRSNFTRQYEHVAVVAHGAHPEYRLEIDAKVNPTDANVKKIVQGSIVSLDENGTYILGCGKGSGCTYPVPCVSMKNVADPDVSTGVAGTDYRTSTYSAVGGVITAIPCTGGYEIETTEFDTTKVYKPGMTLTVDADGKLTLATAQPFQAGSASQVVVGFVSLAAYEASNYNHKRLSFLTNFIPVAH